MQTNSRFSALWSDRTVAARVGLVVGAVVIVSILVGGLLWSMQPEYRALFTNLAEADAAAIVAELKKTHTDYRLTDGGTTIRVPGDRVYDTRLALMSSGAPLSGGVGFEIFDKQGLGATEQSQRVSYQRALQGELARTIGALVHVRQARVLLALPESSLFKRDRQEARAAVSLIMQPGTTLDRDEIAGIQRLVAASVSGLDPARVVVTDQRGITLSGPDALQGPAGVGASRLAMKREIEEYFTHKIADLLDGAYGPGRVIVSVDVALNFDEVHRTVQDLLPAPSAGTGAEPGVRRKRQVTASNAGTEGSSNNSSALSDSAPARTGSSSTDVEYEYGRRVEQVVSAPGSIEQMSVGVVVRGSLSPDKQQHIAQLVKMAAGLNEHRGDAVTVQALEVASAQPAPIAPPEDVKPAVPPAAVRAATIQPWMPIPIAVAIVVMILVAAAFALRRRRAPEPAPLSATDRENLLKELELALSVPNPVNPQRRAA